MELGRLFIAIGIAFILIGLIYIGRDHFPWLKYLGRLPGDFYIKRDNFSFYFPFTTGLLISLVLTLLAHILRR